MVKTNIFADTQARRKILSKGVFSVVEYNKDYSVDEDTAMQRYFESKMNLKQRQLIADINNGTSVLVQAGAMQLMMGEIHASTNVSGTGDLVKKVFESKVTGETVIKPKYEGEGIVVLEPVNKYILLEDVSEWKDGMVIDDGMFLACEDGVNVGLVSRTNLSSTILGGEGLFNTILKGMGVVALESEVPREELVLVELVDDTLKIDGNMAVAWSNSLNFTVEKTTKTLIGSAVSKEGFINVYRGTGKVLIATVKN